MKKILSRHNAAYLFTLLLSIGFFYPQSANAQATGASVTPQPLYRFMVPSANYGFLLTSNYQEGVNLGYIDVGQVGGIVLPPYPGWVPIPGQGLVAMHRWRVSHRAGTNYAYTAEIYPQILANSENTYEGIAGYGLLPSEQWGTPFNTMVLHLWYSQSNGYWYASNFSMIYPTPQPNSSFNYQGIAYRLPLPVNQPFVNCDPRANCFTFQPPPTPQTCNAVQQQSCYENGGTWNATNCTCNYPPEPCRQAGDLGGDIGEGTDGNQRPVMPCRTSAPSKRE